MYKCPKCDTEWGSQGSVTPEGCRACNNASSPAITALINELASKRAMRDAVNSVYHESHEQKPDLCTICGAVTPDSNCEWTTPTGARICEDCHKKLYYNEPTKCGMCGAPLNGEIVFHDNGSRICSKCYIMTYPDRVERPNTVIERYDLIPQSALRSIAVTMGKGATQYGVDDWRANTDYAENMNHALRHINLALLEDTEEEDSIADHIAHAVCRLMMAYETYCGDDNA